MTTEDIYRESQRRSHKLLGVYLSLWAWKNGVDAVIVTREQLLPFLGLERMKDKRVDWLKEDVKPYFKAAWVTVSANNNVYSTLYLTRGPFPAEVKIGIMSDQKRVEAFAKAGIRAAIVKVPKEAEIVRLLAAITHGIADFPSESAK